MANVFQRSVLTKIESAVSKRGEVVIESIKSPDDIKQFLELLRSKSSKTLTERFFRLDRDGTIAVRHKVDQPPDELYLSFNMRPPIIIDLVTVTQDYTRRSKLPLVGREIEDESINRKAFRSNFLFDNRDLPRTGAGVHGMDSVDLLRLIYPHCDPLQRYLLNHDNDYTEAHSDSEGNQVLQQKNAFLHQLRVDAVPDDAHPKEIVYLIEIARRFRSGGERDTCPIPDTTLYYGYQNMLNFRRVQASREDITFWAIQEMVTTKDRNDRERLEYISSVITSENLRQQIQSGILEDANELGNVDSDMPILTGGNHIALLRARSSGYMDGRARFPVMCAAYKDESLLRNNHAPLERNDQFSYRSQVDEKPVLNLTKFNLKKFLKLFFLVISVSSISGGLYLLRLEVSTEETETVISNAITLFFGMATLTLALFFVKEINNGFHFLRTRNGKELWETVKDGTSSRAKVEAVSTPTAKEYFNGRNLSFVGGTPFTGDHEFRSVFSLRDLMRAGYQTTFARDGREVLISRDRTLFRLRTLSGPRARLAEYSNNSPFHTEEPVSDIVLGRQVLGYYRGIWYQKDIEFA